VGLCKNSRKFADFFNTRQTFLTKTESEIKTKICIELDEWMKEEWERVKSILEWQIKHHHNKKESLSEREVLLGLLFGFDTEGASILFGINWPDEL
jgi:hypothetical protein